MILNNYHGIISTAFRHSLEVRNVDLGQGIQERRGVAAEEVWTLINTVFLLSTVLTNHSLLANSWVLINCMRSPLIDSIYLRQITEVSKRQFRK